MNDYAAPKAEAISMFWKRILSQLSEEPLESMAKQILEMPNLVENITCPTLVSASVNDNIHTYDTVMPLFNKIPTLKPNVIYSDVNSAHYVDFTSHGIS